MVTALPAQSLAAGMGNIGGAAGGVSRGGPTMAPGRSNAPGESSHAPAPDSSSSSAEPSSEEPPAAPDGADLFHEGIMAFDGDSTDNADAIELMEQAADAGSIEAASFLGSIYSIPVGMAKPDYKKARQFSTQAADGGDPRGMSDLGELYLDGRGGPKNVKTGLSWLEKAADLGEVSAYFTLGNIYFNGKIVKTDLKKAFDYQLKAADKDNPDSNALVAFRYLYGDGTKKNAAKSAEYLYRAIQLGSEFAHDNLKDYAADRLVISHLQELLQQDSFYDGEIDGSLGPGTRTAVEAAFRTKVNN